MTDASVITADESGSGWHVAAVSGTQTTTVTTSAVRGYVVLTTNVLGQVCLAHVARK